MSERAAPSATGFSAERERLRQDQQRLASWKRWGPYLSERQWGTVREDYSANGDAWKSFGHDMARSRAYRWGEDGIAGLSDDGQRLCLALAFWNERDPFLKERMFGLTNADGNHGEDVKECYYYLDGTPTHSYLRMLYKYPQCAFPYQRLIEENRSRGYADPEFELVDSGAFDDDRYFDIFIEYAKADADDILLRVEAVNRGPAPAPLHILGQLWFRNTWSWEPGNVAIPALYAAGDASIVAAHPELGDMLLECAGQPELLFCNNESNARRLWGATPVGMHYYKDGINDFVVDGRREAVNPERRGTKAAARYQLLVPPGGRQVVRLRLSRAPQAPSAAPAIRRRSDARAASRPPLHGAAFDELCAHRRREADEFYGSLCTGAGPAKDADARAVQRQALAGMIWSKQFYQIDVPRWLAGDLSQPSPPAERRLGRNADWTHLNNADIISMPDKWEYPWYASWDLAFHCLPLAVVDPELAKEQLLLLTREWYMHPNGQLPAYEWSFGDVNPPVHAWAAWRVFQVDRKHHFGGAGDRAFLERIFHKLLLNFTWWVNRKDPEGRNVFQGGFLGLDNIGLFDRSQPLPTGGHLNQADGTSWMAMYCLNMMRIALELALENPVYQDTATKFFEHFLYIAAAMTNIAGQGIGLWDPEDEFYYDVLSFPDGRTQPLKVRSLVGLIPLFAVETLDPDLLERVPEFRERLVWFLDHRPELAALVSRWREPGTGERALLSLLRGHRMKCLLRRMLDETEFFSPFGVRSLSRYHEQHPYHFEHAGQRYSVSYQPAESDSGLFGGNSNWRGPIWMPVNFLIVESLQRFHHYYGDDFKVECPTGSGQHLTIREVADELSARLGRIFLRDDQGRRPVLSGHAKTRDDPHFRDHILFHEYFHGDTGQGLGAAHQTGWTGLIAKLLQPRQHSSPKQRSIP